MLSIDIKKTLPGFTLQVSFQSGPGVTAILGRSGSGKTMTLRCIAGLVTPDEGYIELNNRTMFAARKKVNLRPQQRNTGFVFQNYALFPHLTGYENIAFGVPKKNNSAGLKRIPEIMEKLKIAELANRYPRQLSGGQQQRFALARALAFNPDILLLDEPFSALDTIIRDSMQRLLLEVEQFYNGPVLFVTHNLEEAYRLSRQIAVYDAGQVIQAGSKQEIVNQPINPAVAALTGIRDVWPANRLEADGRRVLFEISPDIQLWARPKQQTGVSSQAFLGIHSCDIQMAADKQTNTLPATVTGVIEEISAFTVLAAINTAGNSNIRAEVKIGKELSPPLVGQICWLKFPEDKLIIMNR